RRLPAAGRAGAARVRRPPGRGGSAAARDRVGLRAGPRRGPRVDPGRRPLRRLPALPPRAPQAAPLRRPARRHVTPLPLEGIKVVDCATLFAGPVVATIMGDYGADVIKVEHPRGDGMRSMGWARDGVSMWWLLISRNKRCVTLKLSDPEGAELFKELIRDADVM